MLTTSYSSLQTFAECPRQWYLNDYRKLKPAVEKRTGALGFGSRIHAAMEAWGHGGDLIESWHDLSKAEYELLPGEWDSSELDKETKLGLVMLEGFLEWFEVDGSDAEFEVVGVEKQVKTVLETYTSDGEPVEIWMYGKLDRLLRSKETGRYRILDWKTSNKLVDATANLLERSPQPRIYRSLLDLDLPGIDIDGVRYVILRKVQRTARATPPFYWNFDLLMSPYNVEAHMTRVRTMASRMDDARQRLDIGAPHEVVVPFNPSWRCDTCVFKAPCALMQHTSLAAGEALLQDAYVTGDPLERYKKEALHEV